MSTLNRIVARLEVSAGALKWIPIGEEKWDGSQACYAEFPNSGYGNAKFVVIGPSPTGVAIGAPFDKAYIDKLATGRVSLSAKFKDRNLSWKFLKPSVPMERARVIAEDFTKQFQKV